MSFQLLGLHVPLHGWDTRKQLLRGYLLDVDGAVDTIDDARIDRLANAVQAADRVARRLEDAMAASASSGRVPKQPAAADGQPEKPSKQAKTSTALRNVRMSTDFMVHELYRKLDGGTSEPSTLVEFFSLLTERLSSDGMADSETEQTTGTLLSDLKHEERQAGMALRQALVPIKHMTEACKQCEALLVNDPFLRESYNFVAEAT